MRKARPKVGPARLVFKHSILDPLLIENVLEEGCGLNFVTGRIGGVDAQIVLHPLQRQVGVSGQAIGWHRAEASADVEAAAGLAAAGAKLQMASRQDRAQRVQICCTLVPNILLPPVFSRATSGIAPRSFYSRFRQIYAATLAGADGQGRNALQCCCLSMI